MFLIYASQQTCVVSEMGVHFTDGLVEAAESTPDNTACQSQRGSGLGSWAVPSLATILSSEGGRLDPGI